MAQNTSSAVTTYRWFVFILVLGYWLYEFVTTSHDAFGWQFRFLTIWGLTANLNVAALMLRYSLGRSQKTYNSFVSASVVLGAIVVFMYWKLYFTDPALVNGNGGLPWYQEYYLHAGTQVLMMIDAFLILGVFRRVLRTFFAMLTIFIAYIVWIEVWVGPRNSLPVGDVTTGLPYPFLNDMAQPDRMVFYATTIGTAIVFLGIGWGISFIIKRLRGASVTA